MFTGHKERKIGDVVMLKLVGVVSNKPLYSVFLNTVNSRRFGMEPRTALSIERDFDPATNVNVLNSTLVRF